MLVKNIQLIEVYSNVNGVINLPYRYIMVDKLISNKLSLQDIKDVYVPESWVAYITVGLNPNTKYLLIKID